MRKLLFIGMAACLMTAGNAGAAEYAVDKGAVVVSGAVDYVGRGGSSYAGRIDFKASRFFRRNLALGWLFSSSEVSANGGSDSNLAVGLTGAYYFGGQESKVYPYTEIGVAHMRHTGGGPVVTGIRYELTVGLVSMMASHFAVTAEIGGRAEHLSGTGTTKGFFITRIGLAGFFY